MLKLTAINASLIDKRRNSMQEKSQRTGKGALMKNGKPNRKSIRKQPSPRNGIIDADGHVRETDEQIMEYMSAGYRSRREAMLYFPLVPHHGWHRSIPANDFRYKIFACRTGANGRGSSTKATSS
jgi:hypothetical protein